MDLLTYIERSPLISTEHTKRIFFQVCTAVNALHTNNVAHLDLKPENIFLNDINSVKLGDFGSSFKCTSETYKVLGERGTDFYSAPEVVRHIWKDNRLINILIETWTL